MEYNKFFDHTILKADASLEDVTKLCREAAHYHFMSVCVNPYWVPVAKKVLEGTDVKVCTVIGFPLGQMTPKAKVLEAKDAIMMGADEVDMVQNVSAALRGDWKFVTEEIRQVKEAVGDDRVLKVILETCYLDRKTIIGSCKAAKKAGADFVKTSTGFGTGGAIAKDVRLMRKTVGTKMGVKASGGIHTKTQMLEMIEAGASRIGCSGSVNIIRELNR